MTEFTFATKPSYLKQNKNTVKFMVTRPDEDISCIAKAIIGDSLMLEDKRFIVTMRPLCHWQKTPGRNTSGSLQPRLTQAVVIGVWEDDPGAERLKKAVADRYRVFTKPDCKYCLMAKQLLTQHGQSYDEFIIDVGQPKDSKKEYITVDQLRGLVPGVRTVPQIFKGDELVGGYEALKLQLGAQ